MSIPKTFEEVWETAPLSFEGTSHLNEKEFARCFFKMGERRALESVREEREAAEHLAAVMQKHQRACSFDEMGDALARYRAAKEKNR